MKSLKNYIYINLSQNFFPIFWTLFSITSIVYFVKLANLTSIIKIDFLELLYLYIIYIPKILYYTLPITSFIAIVLTLTKLSAEYELIVITSFGFSPKKLIYILMPIIFGFSIILFVISFVIVPKMDNIFDNFKKIKQQEAEFNIKAGVYGQKFGKWLIYVEQKENKVYKNITLYQQNKKEDTFISAKSAHILSKGNYLVMSLYNGSFLKITSQNINQIDFEQMVLNNKLATIKNLSTLNDILRYWLDEIDKPTTQKRRFIQNVFMILMPFISVLFYIGLGYFNPRFQKNKNLLFAIGLVVLYMVTTQNLSYLKDFQVFWFILVWIVLSYIVYFYRVKRYY